MDKLLVELQTRLGDAFLPHYKEDAFRSLFAGTALRLGWTLAEPRQASKLTVPQGQTAVYWLTWQHGQVTASPGFVEFSADSKPDIRLKSPLGTYFRAEIKCGFTGSASEGNSNSTKIAADVDLVAASKCELFCGLFDQKMLGRIQGERSSAGRVAEIKRLFGNTAMSDLRQSPYVGITDWQAAKLKTTVVRVVCAGGIDLALALVRLANAQF